MHLRQFSRLVRNIGNGLLKIDMIVIRQLTVEIDGFF